MACRLACHLLPSPSVAYLVLARKYRPERFADMIGQEHITRTLRNAIKEDRVHHAYLFCGVRGLGKTTAARILAKCLVCERGPTDDPCNECAQCTAVNESRSVDVIEIDGASNNKVEHVRGLREQVNYLPQSARRKVYIIDEVHMLTDSAFNALLKTLEEPPEHVTFIFATTEPHKVLQTILSRVSRLDFRRVTVPVLVGHLHNLLSQEGIEAEDDALHLIAQSSEGSVRDGLTLLDKVISFAAEPSRITSEEVRTILGAADRFAIADLLDAIFERDARAVVGRFDEITRSGADLLQLAISILQHLRDLAVVKLTQNREALLDISDGLFDRLSEQAKGVETVVISQHFDRFTRVVEGLETSQIPRLSLEMGLLDLVNAEPLMPMGDLVARLNALSGAGSTGGGSSGPTGGAGRASGGGSKTARTTRAGRRGAQATPAESAPAPATPPEPRPQAEPAPTEPSRNAEPPEPSRNAEPPEPSRNAEPARAPTAPPSNSPLAKQLWGMVSDSLADGPAATGGNNGTSPPPGAGAPASAGDAGFHLTHADEPVVSAPQAPEAPEAACPSSRCIPREPIDYKTMEPIDAWEQLLDRVRGEDDLLFAVLGGLGLSRLGDGVLELAGAKNNFARDHLDERPELRASLQHFIEEYFGESLELKMLDATPSLPELPSLNLIEEKRAADRRAEVEGRARQNPRIRALLAAFDGELREVKPLDDATP